MKFSGISEVRMLGKVIVIMNLGLSQLEAWLDRALWVSTLWGKWLKMITLHIFLYLVSHFKPSGRSGKMRALSFKTGIACLCGTEVKEKLQCEYNSKVWFGITWRDRCYGMGTGMWWMNIGHGTQQKTIQGCFLMLSPGNCKEPKTIQFHNSS